MEKVRKTHTANDVLDRMKEAVEAKNDSELAKVIGVAKTTISSWRKRDSIPYSECVEISFRYVVRLDWLLTGRGQAYERETYLDGPIDYEVMAVVVEAVEHDWEFENLAQELSLQNKAALICNMYRDYGRIVNETTKTGKFIKAAAVALLRRSLNKMIDEAYPKKTQGPQ